MNSLHTPDSPTTRPIFFQPVHLNKIKRSTQLLSRVATKQFLKYFILCLAVTGSISTPPCYADPKTDTSRQNYIIKFYDWASLQRPLPKHKNVISRENARDKEKKGEVYYVAHLDERGTLYYLEKRSHHQREYLYKYTYVQGKTIKRRVNKIDKIH